LGAAAVLDVLPRSFSGVQGTFPFSWLFQAAGGRDSLRKLGERFVSLCLAVTLLTAASRTAAVLGYYHAPVKAWTFAYHNMMAVQHQLFTDADGRQHACDTICVGTEWYRFTSAFFLPEGVTLDFVDSSFGGAL
jgi:hypothetical protein